VTVEGLDRGLTVTISRDRLDAVAVALGVGRIRRGDAVPPLWYWASLAPGCAAGTSVLVRLFRDPRADASAVLRPSAHGSADAWSENSTDLVQNGQVRVQTVVSPLLSPLSGPGPGMRLRVTDESLADDLVDFDALLRLVGTGPVGPAVPPGTVVNRILALLAAQWLRRRTGGQLIALRFNFWSAPDSIRRCRRAVRFDSEGRALFRAGVPGQPVSVTGTAWFGCGPGVAG
jgi:hypothetical protein